MSHEILITFSGTHGAILGEQTLLNHEIPVKVMPLPSAIQAGCGLCLRVSPKDYAQVSALFEQDHIDIQDAYETLPYSGQYHSLGIARRQNFTQALGILPKDAVSIIGCGGKTSLLFHLAEENKTSKVLVSTTTHIIMPEPETIDFYHKGRLISPIEAGVHLFYHTAAKGKIDAIPEKDIQDIYRHFDYTFLECDGSRGLPLKGWAAHEPAPVSFADKTIGVCSIKAAGRILSEEICHRLPLFCETTAAKIGEPVTPAHLFSMVTHPKGMFQKAAGDKLLLINQAESIAETQAANLLASRIQKSNPEIQVYYGSIQNKLCKKWSEQ